MLYWAALLTGASYALSAWDLVDAGGWTAAWKTSGVALMALWAATRARGLDGWLITLALAFGALGDLFLALAGFVAGGAAFAVGHGLAIALYLRNRRVKLSASQRVLGTLVVPVTIAVSALFALPAGMALPVGAYAAFLGVMAGSAWTSRFPRYRVGLGAMLFVASDLLIFAEMGPLAGWALPEALIWPLYFAGQALIAWGVVQTLASGQQVP